MEWYNVLYLREMQWKLAAQFPSDQREVAIEFATACLSQGLDDNAQALVKIERKTS